MTKIPVSPETKALIEAWKAKRQNQRKVAQYRFETDRQYRVARIWKEKNRNQVNAKKRRRYATDNAYRCHVLEVARKWRAKHRERLNAEMRLKYASDPRFQAQKAAYARVWRAKHRARMASDIAYRERVLTAAREYRANNAAHIAEQKRLWKRNNPGLVREQKRRYKARYPEKVRAEKARYRARVRRR